MPGIPQAMAILKTPVHRCKVTFQKSAVASAEALQYVYRLRKSGNAKARMRPTVYIGGGD